MKSKNVFLQIVILVIASSAVAVIANGFAGNTRRLVLPGFYPNALRVPPPETAAPATTAPVATVTMQSPGPGQPPMIVPTTTVERPAGDPAATTTTVAQTTTAAPTPTPAPAPAPAQQQPAPDVLARFQPHPDKPYVEISGDDVAALYSRGVLFLDARRTSVYEEGHIAGARSFSVWEADIDEKVANLFNERNDPAAQNQPIVIYCSGGACEDSHMLAEKLWGVQFNNVYVYKDGYPDWLARNGATRKGGTP